MIDGIVSVIGQTFGLDHFVSSGLLLILESLLADAAAITLLWGRPAWALGMAAVTVVLVLTVGATASELWFVIIVSVLAGARWRPRQSLIATLGLLAYCLAYGLAYERRHPGEGMLAALAVAGVVAAFMALGLTARLAVAANRRQQRRTQQIRAENIAIRLAERRRLAHELQQLVDDQLSAALTDLNPPANGASAEASTTPKQTSTRLRAVLDRHASQARATLAEMRALLELLRDDDPELLIDSPPTPGWLRPMSRLTQRPVRITLTLALILLCVVGQAGLAGWGGDVSPLLVMVAGGVALWRPSVGVLLAWAGLAICVLRPTTGVWDVGLTALVALAAALRPTRLRTVLTLVGLGCYIAAVLAWGGALGPSLKGVWIAYLACLMAAVGAWTRPLLSRRAVTADDRRALVAERAQIHREERGSVARDLHDVVAHQLSLSSLRVMASAASTDPDQLQETVTHVRRHTEVARAEVRTLVLAMRDPAGPADAPGSLIRPDMALRALISQLREAGFEPATSVSPGLAELDHTTQRTVTRILQESTTNILRYAAHGKCHYQLEVDPDGVRLQVRSQLARTTQRSSLSTGHGLRGIRERVELCHGKLRAGPVGPQWVVEVALPAASQPRSDELLISADQAQLQKMPRMHADGR